MTACPKGKCLLTGCQNTGESIFITYQDFITLTSSAASVQTPSMPRRADDPDWVFFRGFGAKRREDVVDEEVSTTCPNLFLSAKQMHNLAT